MILGALGNADQNENANDQLRRYLPKGIDLSGYSQSKLNAIARRLNERPRKTLDYETQHIDFMKLLRRRVESARQSGPKAVCSKANVAGVS